MNPASPTDSRPQLRFALHIALILLLCSGALVLHALHRLNSLADGLLEHYARTLAANVAALTRADVAANDGIALASRLESFNEFAEIRALAVADRQGLPLAAVQRNAAGNLSAIALREIAPLEAPGGAASDGESLVIWAAIGPIAPIGWVRVEYERASANALLRRAQLETLAVGLVLTLLAVAATTLVLQRRAGGRRPPPVSRAE